MAAQVLSGTGNVTYTNSTGQNVRVVINYLHNDSNVNPVNMTFQGVSVTIPKETKIGKSLAYSSGNLNYQGFQLGRGIFGGSEPEGAPTEIALSNGETFSISFIHVAGLGGGISSQLKYNIIIIPEAG